MKIIELTPFMAVCICGEILEFEKEDIHTLEYGMPYVTCPTCKEEVEVNYNFAKKIKKSNITFPDDYFCYKKEYTDIITNEEVNSWVARCISKLEEQENDYDILTHDDGDTHIEVYKHDGEYEIIISKNYYRCIIERE